MKFAYKSGKVQSIKNMSIETLQQSLEKASLWMVYVMKR